MRVKLRARATGGWPATWPRKPKCSPKNCCARYSPEARLKSPKMFPFFRPFLQAKGKHLGTLESQDVSLFPTFLAGERAYLSRRQWTVFLSGCHSAAKCARGRVHDGT